MDNSRELHSFVVGNNIYSIEYDSGDMLIGENLRQSQTWEEWQLAIYSKVIQPNMVCLDIGGNVGTNAIAMATYATAGKVYTFEPVHHTYNLLVANIERNAFRNILPINSGVSDHDGKASIIIDPHMLGNAHQITDETATIVQAGGTPYETQTMTLEALDNWSQREGINTADFVKVDVEGYESEVLAGGTHLFSANPSLISIWELSVIAQRDATPLPFPTAPKDVSFVESLLKAFAEVYLISRSGHIYKVHSYAHLRCMMIGGYPVEDLLCCQVLPPALTDIQNTSWQIPSALIGNMYVSDKRVLAIVNRGADGWSAPSISIDGTRSGVYLNVSEPTSLIVEFQQVQITASAYLLVVCNEEVRFADLSVPTELTFTVPAGTSWLFLESTYQIRASEHFGNLEDSRVIGFKFRIKLGDEWFE